MKIAIDCCDLDCEQINGTRIYIKNLLDRFGALASKDEFWLFHKREFGSGLAPKIFSNYRDCKIPYPVWWTQTRFAYEIKRGNFDVVWMPIQQLPLDRNKTTYYVVTIHDLAWKYFPENYHFSNRLKLDFFAETAIKRADKLIAISETTKKDILKFYPKTNPNKISVVHHGFEQRWLKKKFSVEQKKAFENKYQIKNKEYLLYVGGLNDKENVVVLVAAFERLKEQTEFKKLKLVLVGEEGDSSQKTRQKINCSWARKDIVTTGRVDFSDLALFYQMARIFVLPSKYEGFGLPILEAFVARIPVITTNQGASLEIGDQAARYFNGKSAKQLEDQLLEVLKNEILARKMIQAGQERAKAFSWGKCALETLAAIKRINN